MPEIGTLLLYASLCIGVGGIPFALLLGFLRGVDIRKIGSGNVGATNLGRALGVSWGVVAFCFDAAKGVFPILLWREFFMSESNPEFWPAVVGGVLAVLAHCFSPYLKLRGGKGVATAAGVLAALDWILFLALLVIWAGAVAIWRNVGIASSTTALASGILGVLLWTDRVYERPHPQAIGVYLVGVSVVVLARHRQNLREFFVKRSTQ